MATKIFDTVRERAPKKSGFDLSHEKKLSMKFGKLTPMLLQEVMPGDVFKGRTEALIRMAPMVAPIMHRVDAYIHYFNVPNRIIWPEWEDFITGGDKGTEAPNMPVVQIGSLLTGGKGTLTDYFGIPTMDEDALAPIQVSALPYRAYHEIWNEYYRDQNLQEPFDWEIASSAEMAALQTRAYEKDYFTSALPYPQKGPAVELPLDISYSPQYKEPISVNNLGNPNTTPADWGNGDTGRWGSRAPVEAVPGTPDPYIEHPDGWHIENLADQQSVDSTSITIEELRRASRLQEWLEIAARAGSRYKELIKSMFGTNTGDARLDRPEYIGGGKIPISISEVLNTVGVEGQAPQGDMAGHGIAVGAKSSFFCKVKEHGHIIGIMSILPKTGYQQGLARLWGRRDKFDFPWPKFANLGEQAVKNSELYQDYTDATENDLTFGYVQRYGEYKYAENTVHGDFRDDLDFWHLSRKFANRPQLNEEFIQCDNADNQRIFAVTDPNIDKFYVQLYNQVQATRPLPYFSNPTL